MSVLVLWKRYRIWVETGLAQKVFEVGIALLVGLMVGALIVFSWGMPSKWQQLIVAIPIALTLVLLINDLNKIMLAAIAISVPLNLDVALVVSPYARIPENIVRGHRTLAGFTDLSLSLAAILVIVGYALWLVVPRGERKPVRFFAGTSIPALGLIFFSILSVFQARDWQLSSFRVVQLLEQFLVYFYLANSLRTVQDMQFFVTVALGAMLVESVLMLVQWNTGTEFIIAGVQAVADGPGRVGGTLGATGPAAGYLSALALIACAMMWASPRRSQKILAALCFGLGTVALIGTGSRIGLIAFAVTVLGYVLIELVSGRVQRGSLVLLILVVLIVGVMFYDAIYTRYTAEDYGSAESRPMMYRLAWNMIRAHPWLGVGSGNYALLTPDYFTSDVGTPEYVIDVQIHNRYLLVWAESGSFAVLCYVSFLGSAIIKAWSCIKSKQRWISLMGAGLGCAILSLCIQMFTGSFHMRGITLFVWLLVALAAGLHNLGQANSSPSLEPGSST